MHESTLPTATACKQTRRQSGQRACAQPCDCALAPCPYQISTQHTPSSTYIVARLMARLNEAPVPTESVDARKSSCIPPSLSPTLTCRSKAPLRATEPRTRKVCASIFSPPRFFPSNWLSLRNNSAQCLRIRALECEVSRLLAENLDLREDIVHLQAQLSEPRSHVDNSALVSVKDQLQAKLLDLGNLVSELGRIQQTHSSAPQDKFSDPSSWRPEVPAAILSGQAPRMDGIVEEASSPGGSLQYVQTQPPSLYHKLTRLDSTAIILPASPITATLRLTSGPHQSFISITRIL
jgi:hypothetical protein